MTMSSSMRNVRMHYYTDATAASVPRSILQVVVMWIWHVTICGPTGRGKWSQQTQSSILTREVYKFQKRLRFSQIVRTSSYNVLGASTFQRTWFDSGGFFWISLDVEEAYWSSWYENSENMTFFKILKFSFSEFRKNRCDNFSKSI